MNILRKYNINKALFLAIPLALLTNSCGKEFLNIKPELVLPEEESYETKNRIEALVSGLYGSLKIGNFYAGRFQIYNDIRGEEFINRNGNVVTGFSTYQFTNDANDTYVANFWIHGYLTINRVNKFIIDFERPNNSGVTAEEKKVYISEAKFIRALTYYSLVQLFAKPYTLNEGASKGIPLRLNAETNSQNNNLALNSVKEIYTQILKDLNEAEQGLPVTVTSDVNRTTRAHRNTAIALKTRVYLAMGDFPKVIAEANKIVTPTAPFTATSGVAHALNASPVTGFTNFRTLENILSWPYESTNAPGTQNQLGYYYNVGNLEYYLNPNSPGIYANPEWRSTDLRKSGLTRMYALSSALNVPLLSKWGAAPFLDWVPVIRYAEVLLNLAEAEAEVGSLTRAQDLLKAVRNRSDGTYEFSSISVKPDLINAILLERRIELLGEGFRAPDLQRRLMPLTAVGLGSPVPVSDNRYVFPIPTGEKLTNNES